VITEGVEKTVLGRVVDAAVFVHAFAQADESLDGVKAIDGPVLNLHHQELGGVGTNVNGCEAHGETGRQE
jgi:hypothetical protein